MTRARPESTVDLVARECLAVRLRLLNRVVTSRYDEALRPIGLRVSQLNILIVTAKMGVARPADICDLLQLERSTVSRNVERMRARGWLEVIEGEDGRARNLRVTSKGHGLIRRAQPAWSQAQKSVKKLLGADGVAALQSAATAAGFGKSPD